MIEFLHFLLFYDFVLLFIASLICTAVTKKYPLPERLARYIFLLPIGVAHIFACVRNMMYFQEANILNPIPPTHFEYKVALANIGITITGILAFRKNFSFCFGTALFYFVFAGSLWIEYVIQFNSGPSPVQYYWIFGTLTFLLPLLALSLFFWHRSSHSKKIG